MTAQPCCRAALQRCRQRLADSAKCSLSPGGSLGPLRGREGRRALYYAPPEMQHSTLRKLRRGFNAIGAELNLQGIAVPVVKTARRFPAQVPHLRHALPASFRARVTIHRSNNPCSRASWPCGCSGAMKFGPTPRPAGWTAARVRYTCGWSEPKSRFLALRVGESSPLWENAAVPFTHAVDTAQ